MGACAAMFVLYKDRSIALLFFRFDRGMRCIVLAAHGVPGLKYFPVVFQVS